MKIIVFAVLFLWFYPTISQEVFPFVDNIGYLRSFEKGYYNQIDFLSPLEIKFSEKIVAFRDNKNDFYVYDGLKKEKLSKLANNYQVGIGLLAWNTGPVLNLWDNGVQRTLTMYGGTYFVSDSLVVYEDLIENAVRVYYRDSIYELFRTVGNIKFPSAVGSNSVAFEGNGGINYAFVAGKIIEIGVMNNPVHYSCGGNLVAFNDPFNKTFSIVESNEIIDLETIQMKDYKVGYEMVVYRDLNNQLMVYKGNKLIELSNYSASFYEVFRNMIVWGEGQVFFAYDGQEKYELCNYIPKEYKLRNGIVAFRNFNHGVSLFKDGKVEIISNIPNAGFEVNGSSLRIEIANGRYQFFYNGKIWEM